MYSVMWSEHCSYKSSKVHLQQFGELAQETPLGKMLAGIGENAGVLDIGQGYAVTFKIESHNHPSYVEPYQGAATGVGGIVRDILAMGARPVAVMDPLRFGPLDADDTHRVLPGIVAGVGGYGNCLGLPNIGGEVVFDETYLGNPLVNALCVGVLRHEDLHLAKAVGQGNLVIMYGARTGGDGIGGASILASETFEADGPAKRPSVQVGDPFMEKLLIECTLELFAAGVVAGIQDFGAAGISCATSELAAAGDGGMHVDLDKVLAARLHAEPGGDLDERVPGTHDGGRRPRRRGDVPGHLREVGRRGDHHRRGHRRRAAGHRLARRDHRRRRPAHRRARRPGLRAAVRPPGLAGRPPGRRRRGAAATARRRRAARDRAAAGRLAQPVRQVVDHRPVRPLRARRHRARPAQRRRDDPRRRGDRARRRARHRRQRPLRQARPVRRRAARPGRGLPQRRHGRRDAGGGLRLPQLRLARGPGRDVAVRRGLPRAQGRLRDPRHPGDRRQRQPLQPDRRRRRSCPPRWWRCSASSTTSPSARRPASPGPASWCCTSARPARSCPARSGRTSCTATSAVGRRRSTSPTSATSPGCWSTPAAPGC